MKLALVQAGGKAGPWTVNYKSLNDSTAAKASYDLGQCDGRNARKVATDSEGHRTTSASSTRAAREVAIPILNQAGIPMISPANTYVGLTTNEPGSAPGRAAEVLPDAASATTCGSCRATRSRPPQTCWR